MSFIRTNLPEKLLAVALTVLLFWSVNRSQTPEASTSFSKRVVYQGVPPGMKVVGDPQKVLITATGDRVALDLAERTGPEAVTAAVHLSSARVGTQNCDVFPSIRPDLLAGLKWKVVPDHVEITLASESDKTVSVVAVPKNYPKGFKERSWTAEPSVVLVSGEERLISRVATAEIRYDPSDPASFDSRLPIVLVDQRGRVVRGQLTLSPALGTIVPSKSAAVLKHVPIVPTWRGVLPRGLRMSGYRVVPGQITVRGAGAVLDQLTSVSTQPLVLNGISSDQTIPTTLVVPDGVQLPKPVSVQVQVSVEKSEDQY